jgi:hypothetical protein
MYLYPVAKYYNWTFEVFPFAGSEQEQILKSLFALGDTIDAGWGSGFQDASHRSDYDPSKLNVGAHDAMGFFPDVSPASIRSLDWVEIAEVPTPAQLSTICQNHSMNNHCYIKLPDEPHVIQDHMVKAGGFDKFITPELQKHMLTEFLKQNEHRLTHYRPGSYNIAIHVRRGDILDPDRWIDQSVYAALARRICEQHGSEKQVDIHIFSSGKNRDGGWEMLENIGCGNVVFHLDELEFDSWTHMATADALVLSKSAFSAVPALLNLGEVYYPSGFWHIQLPAWHLFNSQTGAVE